jgi:hypothetical protein
MAYRHQTFRNGRKDGRKPMVRRNLEGAELRVKGAKITLVFEAMHVRENASELGWAVFSTECGG